MRAIRALVGAAVLASGVAVLPAQSSPTNVPRPPKSRVVVAVIDTAPNPFHEFFHAGGPLYKKGRPDSVTPAVLREFGIDKRHIIRIRQTGDFARDFGKVRKQFDRIKKGEPYWFAGTNIIGISFLDRPGGRLRPDSTSSPHGIGTSASVLAANPEAIVVSVEAPGAEDLVPGFGTNPLGERWAFNHPAVDIISTSYGPPGSPPLMYHLKNGYKGVVKKGKLHFGAADNSPALSPIDATSGPWWTIGVAGFQEGESEGRQLRSGTFPDFVADWTQTLPYCRSCETGTQTVSGTSFSTPMSAGVMSKILLNARRKAGHRGGIRTRGVKKPLMVTGIKLTNWQLRRALEQAAVYPGLDDYNAGFDGGMPVLDAAPWAFTGWGVITPARKSKVVASALAHLGIGGGPKRKKDAAACGFMTANMRAREAWWNNAYFSESKGKMGNPYIYC